MFDEHLDPAGGIALDGQGLAIHATVLIRVTLREQGDLILGVIFNMEDDKHPGF